MSKSEILKLFKFKIISKKTYYNNTLEITVLNFYVV